MSDINKSVEFIIKIANDNTHGYDQIHRYGPDYDCSSLVAASLIYGGFKVSKTSWTGNLRDQLTACGFTPCTRPWKAGDIHLNNLHHVCMSIDADRIAQASINEKGGIKGGVTGDQTGSEINIKPYYEYKYGWDIHLRYSGPSNNTTNYIKTGLYDVALDTIKGVYGNADERKNKLEKLGYNYQSVQNLVNDLIKVANDVINGDYGNGNQRVQALTSLGYNANEVQKVVNLLV